MNKKQSAIIVSGYFNLIYKRHIEYFQEVKDLGNVLFNIVNNGHQRQLKRESFKNEAERLIIVQNIKPIHEAVLSIDQDLTVCKSIEHLVEKYDHLYDFTFANGGDQNNQSIPEAEICKQLNVDLADGLGDKIQSSSWLLKKKENK